MLSTKYLIVRIIKYYRFVIKWIQWEKLKVFRTFK